MRSLCVVTMLFAASAMGCGEDGASASEATMTGEATEATEATESSGGADEGETTTGGGSSDGATSDEGSTGSTATNATTTGEDSTSSSSGEDSSGDPEVGCEAYISKIVACFADGDQEFYRESLATCEEGIVVYEDLYGVDCVNAQHGYQACFIALSCAELEGEGGCDAEAEIMTETCTSEPGPICAAYGAKVTECTGELGSNAAAQCQTQLDTYGALYGELCGQAVEDYYVCDKGLACDESGCDAELEALFDLCA